MYKRQAQERGGNPADPNKRNPLDFVLWQPSLADEPAWESRWGAGRPGWHIECSALARRELGDTIDIHGGGRDLVFPHHECEIAQCESVTNTPFVRHWVHVGLVALDGQKTVSYTHLDVYKRQAPCPSRREVGLRDRLPSETPSS